MSKRTVSKDVSQRNDDLDLGEPIGEMEFLDQETGETVWLDEVKPRKRKRITKAELQAEVDRLREKLDNKDGHKVLKFIHMIAEIVAIGAFMVNGVNLVDLIMMLILAIHIGITTKNLLNTEEEV